MDLNSYFNCYPKPNSDEFTDFIKNYVPLHKSRSAQKNLLKKNYDKSITTPTVRAFLMYLYFTRTPNGQQEQHPQGLEQQINRDDEKENEVQLSPQEKGYNKFINSIAFKKLNSIQPGYGEKYLDDYKNEIDVDWDEVQQKVNTYYKKRFPN